MKEFLFKYKNQLAFVLILSLAYLIRTYHLDTQNLWRDEAFSVNASLEPLTKLISISVNDTNPPLHMIILHFWIKVFGSGEYAVRLLSVVAGVATVFFVFKIGEKIFNNKTLIYLATIFASVNPLLVIYSQEARSYSLLTALSTALIYLTLKLEKKFINYVLFSLTAVLGLYTHNIFLIILIVITAYILLNVIRSKELSISKEKFQKLIAAYLLIGLLYIPWLIVFVKQLATVGSDEFWLKYEPMKNFKDTMYWMFTGQYFETGGFFNSIAEKSILILSFIFLIKGFYREFKEIEKKIPLLTFFIVGIIITVATYSLKTPLFYIRYLVFLAPAVILLATKGVYFEKKNKLKFLEVGVFIILLIITGLFTYKNTLNYEFKPAYKAAVNDIIYNPESTLILHPQALTIHSYKYYSRGYPSYIFDPNNEVKYYEGLAGLDDSNFFQGDLNDYDKIWVFTLDGYSKHEKYLEEAGFEKLLTWNGENGLTREYWIRSQEKSLAYK